ncbi:MAG: hypothetical protein ACRC1U_05385, partial [Vibrionaceae bacterium]
ELRELIQSFHTKKRARDRNRLFTRIICVLKDSCRLPCGVLSRVCLLLGEESKAASTWYAIYNKNIEARRAAERHVGASAHRSAAAPTTTAALITVSDLPVISQAQLDLLAPNTIIPLASAAPSFVLQPVDSSQFSLVDPTSSVLMPTSVATVQTPSTLPAAAPSIFFISDLPDFALQTVDFSNLTFRAADSSVVSAATTATITAPRQFDPAASLLVPQSTAARDLTPSPPPITATSTMALSFAAPVAEVTSAQSGLQTSTSLAFTAPTISSTSTEDPLAFSPLAENAPQQIMDIMGFDLDGEAQALDFTPVSPATTAAVSPPQYVVQAPAFPVLNVPITTFAAPSSSSTAQLDPTVQQATTTAPAPSLEDLLALDMSQELNLQMGDDEMLDLFDD